MKLAEMRALLAQRGIRLTKSLGQNFLHDGNQLRRIVEAAELSRTDQVLEIGPGVGPLTELLVAQAGEVLAIEKDARLVEYLRTRFPPLALSLSPPAATEREHGGSDGERLPKAGEGAVHRPGGKTERNRFQLLHDDALEFLRRETRDWNDWKLVANLPYSVASPILVELAQMRGKPERMVVTLQLEVARRLMAKAGEDDYGVLTLLIQLDYEFRGWFKIPASCFFPKPDVDSACVVLVRRGRALLSDERRGAFTEIVKRAFSQRRKMMMKLLRQDWPDGRLLEAFTTLGLSPQSRAESVDLSQFVRLTELLSA